MQRVALTGGIATGKSHVLAVFTALGVPTIDADLLAREAVAPGTPGFEAVKARFNVHHGGRARISTSDHAFRRISKARLFSGASGVSTERR